MKKKSEILRRMRLYADRWNTEEYGYVLVTGNGRFIPTNNLDSGELRIDKKQFRELILFIDQNT